MKPPLILLASHNGAPWLEAQLESIRAQTVEDWHLIVRDDGSSDDSVALVDEFARQDERIELVAAPPGSRQGACANFDALLRLALERRGDVFFLADQDDSWRPDKLARLLAMFPEAGAESEPLLVHSDLSVVDEDLRPLHDSLTAFMALAPECEAPLSYLLTRNFVTGCALAANRRLLEAALPIPADAIMHDWWLALVAAGTGRLSYLPESLVAYRQHSSNAIGARGFWHGLNPMTNWVAGWQRGNEEYRATLRQGAALAARAAARPDWPRDAAALLRDFAELPGLPPLSRLARGRALRLRQGNGLLQLILFLRLMTVSVER